MHFENEISSNFNTLQLKHVIYIFIIFILIAHSAISQNDTTIVFSYDDYFDIVKSNHPVAKLADLQLQKGEATLLKSRGAFDPKIFTDASKKHFDDKQYYSLVNGGLKIPTWFGVELKGAYEQNQGYFLNAENSTPSSGLMYAGISVPIGQRLFIDERRAELKQAKLYKESTKAEQELILNELLYDAGKVYWDWFKAYHVMQVYQNTLKLAQQRFEAVKQGALLGDKPTIDTLEAGIQVQNRKLSLQEAQLDFANSSALLSIYLWAEGIIPLEIAEGTIPIPLESNGLPMDERFYTQLDTLINSHPAIQQTRFKINQLEIEKRWKLEQLKPELNLKYNAIAQPISGDPFAAFSPNNYTWGLEFSMPLFLRKERGNLKLANIKIQEAQLNLTTKQASLTYKAKASLNEWQTTNDQKNMYVQTVRDYKSLLEGEQQMFNAGESSLFMVNSREMSYINAQIKLIELYNKNRKARLTTGYAFGILNQ